MATTILNFSSTLCKLSSILKMWDQEHLRFSQVLSADFYLYCDNTNFDKNDWHSSINNTFWRKIWLKKRIDQLGFTCLNNILTSSHVIPRDSLSFNWNFEGSQEIQRHRQSISTWCPTTYGNPAVWALPTSLTIHDIINLEESTLSLTSSSQKKNTCQFHCKDNRLSCDSWRQPKVWSSLTL